MGGFTLQAPPGFNGDPGALLSEIVSKTSSEKFSKNYSENYSEKISEDTRPGISRESMRPTSRLMRHRVAWL